MNYESWIAFKHLTRRRKTGFISLISFISVLGVAVGVMALIVVLAVMSGFDRELKNKIVSVNPHLRIEKENGIESPEALLGQISSWNHPQIQTVSPFVEGQAIVRSSKNATGVLVKGINPLREDLSIFSNNMLWGNLNFTPVQQTEVKRLFFGWFKRTKHHELPAVVIGQGLARLLGVGPEEEVSLIVPDVEPG